MSASSQYYSVTARVGVPHRHEVEGTDGGEGGKAVVREEEAGFDAGGGGAVWV